MSGLNTGLRDGVAFSSSKEVTPAGRSWTVAGAWACSSRSLAGLPRCRPTSTTAAWRSAMNDVDIQLDLSPMRRKRLGIPVDKHHDRRVERRSPSSTKAVIVPTTNDAVNMACRVVWPRSRGCRRPSWDPGPDVTTRSTIGARSPPNAELFDRVPREPAASGLDAGFAAMATTRWNVTGLPAA